MCCKAGTTKVVSRKPHKKKSATRAMLEAMIVKNQVVGVVHGVAKASGR